jgi:hypothetical protein
MDEEPKGCPSCQAVAATWIGGCDNPIHIHQANAHILHLEQQLATVTQERDERDNALLNMRKAFTVSSTENEQALTQQLAQATEQLAQAEEEIAFWKLQAVER